MQDYRALTLEIMDLVGNKWTLLIVYTLGEGAIRFSELRRRTAPISQKMLTQTLPAKRSIAPCPGRRCITAPGMPPDRQRRYRQHGA